MPKEMNRLVYRVFTALNMFASAVRCQYATSAPLLKVTKKQMDGLSAKVSDIVVLATSNIKAAKPRNKREKTQPKTPEGMC